MKSQREPRRALIFATVLFTSLCGLATHPRDSLSVALPAAVYDPDLNQPWNRLHACLFVRQSNDGKEYGADTLDPLLWGETKHLLTGESHRQALECLDEFLRTRAEKHFPDPLKRAVFQRDLWAVFDWAASGGERPSAKRRALLARLSLAMRRVALTPDEIGGLPDTYSDALASRHFPAEYSPAVPHRAFLPPDLFQPDGPWICLSGYSDEPTALGHFSGRSRFLIFMRLPGGREATLRYVRSLRSSTEPPIADGGRALNLKLPQFPVGTEVALVRQMMLLDANGNLAPSAVTESVQLRVYHAVTPGPAFVNFHGGPASHDQDFFEFRFSRPALFAHRDGGLIPVQPREKGYATQFTFGYDPFETTNAFGRGVAQPGDILTCAPCHSDSGIHSVQSRVRWMNGNQGSNQPGWNPSVLEVINWETARTIDLKRKQDRFILLQQYWRDSGAEVRTSAK
jgi:hypothetical protein